MKKFFSALCVCTGLSFGSMLGLDALGEEQVMGGTASLAGRGFAGNAKTGDAEGLSVVNPAKLAFDTKVVFNLNFLMEMDAASNHGSQYVVNSLSLPSFNLSFPMGDFGAMGLSLWQHYSANLDEEYEDEKSGTNTHIVYQGSVYELVPTYAVRLPFLRALSLGGAAHFVMGNNSRSLTLDADLSGLAEKDQWGVRNAAVTENVEGSWEIKNHPAYYTMALQYRGRTASYFFSFTTGYTLSNELDYDFRNSETDTLASNRNVREIEVPAMFATGVNYRLNKRHNLMLDLQWRPWESNVANIAGGWNMAEETETQSDFMASIGYQYDGSSVFYDPYWKRISYRAGAWYKNWYIKDVSEAGGSLGAGFPLGRKGTTFDLAFQGGMRFADLDNEWDEKFFAIRIGLTGIASWGQNRK